MEETGSISYWSILFQANSFSDLLDRVDMIHEIAKSDQIMMKKLSEATAAVEQLRSELEQQKRIKTARAVSCTRCRIRSPSPIPTATAHTP